MLLFHGFVFSLLKREREKRATVHESKVGEGSHDTTELRKKARLKTELMGKTPQFQSRSQSCKRKNERTFFFLLFFLSLSPYRKSLITELKSWTLFMRLKYDKLQMRKKKPVPPYLYPSLHPQFTPPQQGAQTQPEVKT